ncbi:MAG: Rid family detoxifying hydrolase [bacterium]
MKKMTVVLVMLLIVLGCSTQPIQKQVISSPNAPAAIGPYSQAIRVGNTLYLAGQLGMIPETGKLAEGFEAQARQALKNHKSIIEEAGFSMTDVVQVQVFVSDMNEYPKFNAIYTDFFKSDYPARGVLEVSRIPANGLIEIMMVAVKTG